VLKPLPLADWRGSEDLMHELLDKRLERKNAQDLQNRWPAYAVCLLILYSVARAIVAAHSRPLWYDEIFTWAMARQPSVGAIWAALLKGADSQGLLFDLVQRVVAWTPSPEVGFRIPSILGFAVTMACIYTFVKRSSGDLYGLIAAASLLVTALFISPDTIPCTIDARAYSLSVACIAIALVAYQRADTYRWVSLMAIALALAVSLHYYAIFVVVPFIAAEAFYSWLVSRVRWSLWIGFAAATVPIAIFWQHLAALRSSLSQGFWAKPSLWAARDAYGHFFSVSNNWGFAIFIACSIWLFQIPSLGEYSILSILRRVRFSSLDDSRDDKDPSIRLQERVLAFFLMAMPFFVLIASKISRGGYYYHYFLYSILGFALAVGFILPQLGRRTLALSLTFICGFLAVRETSFWLSRRNPIWRLQPPAAVVEALVSGAGHGDLPVFINSPQDFLQFHFYGSPAFASRLVFIADGPSALRYGSFDTDDEALPRLAGYYPIKVPDFQSFRSSHSSFLLYASVPRQQDWWLRRLIDDGCSVQLAASQALPSGEEGFAFLITAPR
jgi:hypothetical protein